MCPNHFQLLSEFENYLYASEYIRLEQLIEGMINLFWDEQMKNGAYCNTYFGANTKF